MTVFLVPQAFRVLAEDAGVADLLESNRHQLQGRQIKPAELFNLCNALPFMDPRRLVVVEGLLATQERRAGRSRGRKRRRRPGGLPPWAVGMSWPMSCLSYQNLQS